MDFEALQTFVTIHEAGGFSAAAETLHRSQPAISRRIALLEDEVGAPLFERTASRVVLSEAGRTLLPHAERALASLRDASAAMAALRTGEAGEISLAAVGTLAGSNLTGRLKAFAAVHPSVGLSIRTATSLEVSDLVRRGDAVLGLRYLARADADLAFEHIADEPMQVICPSGHALAGRAVASLAELRDEAWLAFPSALEARETYADNIFSQFQARGIASVTWSPIDSLTAQKRLVEAGFGLALMSLSATAEERASGALSVITVDDLAAANPVYLVTRKGGYLSPAAKALAGILRDAGLAN